MAQVDQAMASAPFFGLPTELRLQVYRHLFQDSKVLLTGRFGGYAHKRGKGKGKTWPILLACHTIYNEALDLYWSLSRVSSYVTRLQLPEILPAGSTEHIQHLFFRLYTLSAPWESIIAGLDVFPKLETLVVREEALNLDSVRWRTFHGSRPSEDAAKDEDPTASWVCYHIHSDGRKGASYSALGKATYPLNRVLCIPLATESSEVVPFTGEGPRSHPRKFVYYNFGNGEVAVVPDTSKTVGLMSVLS
ncbi:putative F-box domain-containing protein [Seiridium cardinale]|uniref:F-box domain-containing protein n=1 Tax=Seiridium cardinale TaxID=138064 RepID=A0ABR2XA22_9PEZI